MNFPSTTIIIPTKNNAQTIGQCIQAIFDMDYPNDKLEVIIIDAYSIDETISICKKYPVKIIQKRCNVPAAYNFILKMISSEIIGFVDGDAKVERNWLKILVEHLEDLKVAGVGGTILTWNNNKLVPRLIGYDINSRYKKMPQNITRIATTNLILRKDVLLKIGGFDESLPTGYDAEIGYKLIKKGYQLIFEPNAIIYHWHRPNLKAFFMQQYKYSKNDIPLYSKAKNYSPLITLLVRGC